jgi:hypothetical protein
MANIYHSDTQLWVCDEVGLLVATGIQVVIIEIIYFPSAINDDLIIQNGAGVDAVILKAGASDTSPIRWSGPMKINGLKIGTIDGGKVTIRYYDMR